MNFFPGLLEEINQNLSRYLRGQGLICMILSIYYATTLFLMSLDFGIILGIFAGLISFIPYVGAFLGLIIAILLGFTQFGLSFILVAIILVFLFGQIIESYYLSPKFIGEAIKLNPYHFGAMESCGSIWLSKNEIRKAYNWFQKALEINPNTIATANNIEMIFLISFFPSLYF